MQVSSNTADGHRTRPVGLLRKRSRERDRMRMASTLAVALMLSLVLVPTVSDETVEADEGYWTFSIDDSITYGSDLVGYTPVTNTSSTLDTVSDTGSWGFGVGNPLIDSTFYATFTPDGNLYKKLDPDDLTRYMDGSDASTDIATMNVLWCIPTVYQYVVDGDLYLTNDPSSVTSHSAEPLAHTVGDRTYDYLGIGVYEGTISDGKYWSVSGSKPQSYTDESLATAADYAEASLPGAHGHAMIWNMYQWNLYKNIVWMAIGGFDSQASIGEGAVNCDDYLVSGLTDTLGPFAGSTGDYASPVKAYIENVWGSMMDTVDDTYFNNGYMYYGQREDVTTGTGFGSQLDSARLSSDYGYIQAVSTNLNYWGVPIRVSWSNYESGMMDFYSNSNFGYYEVWIGGGIDEGGEAGVCYMSTGAHAPDTRLLACPRLAYLFDEEAIPETVTYDHTALSNFGVDVSGLSTGIAITGPSATYTQLPETQGYVHIGWYVDGQFYTPTATVASTSSHTAYSAWRAPSVTITFYVEGEVYATLDVPRGSSGILFTPEMVEGVFGGWYTDPSLSTKFNPDTVLNSDIDLYAKGVPPLIFISVPTAEAVITQVNADGLFLFDATDSDGRYSIHWDFGDGNSSDELLAYNTYSQPGTYEVSLTVTNAYGESAVGTFDVHVQGGDVPGGADPDGTDDSDGGAALYVAVVGAVLIVSALVVRTVL